MVWVCHEEKGIPSRNNGNENKRRSGEEHQKEGIGFG